MRLHRMRLWNFAGIAKKDVEFFQGGVTVVEGPNEVGKSSMSKALGFAIKYPDSSKHSDLDKVKQVGSDKGPEVEITLSTGRYSLVYRKRWLRRPRTKLSVTAPQIENLDGREAHDRLLEILDEPKDRDMLATLQIDQGIELEMPSFKNSISLLSRIFDRDAGGELSSADEDIIMEQIRREYDEYWTRTGRVTAKRRASESRVEEAKQQVDDIKGQMASVENDAGEMARLIDDAERIRANHKVQEEDEQKLSARWDEIGRIRNNVERLNSDRGAAESRRDQAGGQWERRQELLKDVETRTGDLAALETEAEKVAPTYVAVSRRSEKADEALKRAVNALQDAEDRRSRAVADRDFLRQQIEVEQITERYDRYVKAEQTLKEAEEYLKFSKVDDGVVENIEEAYIEDERAKAGTERAAASVETRALTDIAIQVGGRQVRLATNEVDSMRVEDEVELVIPGVVRMQVSAGEGAKRSAERQRRTSEAYLRLCDEYGVAGLDEARRAAQSRRDALRNQAEARKAIKENLRDWTPDIMLANIEQLTERVAAYPVERPAEPPMPAKYVEADRLVSQLEVVVGDRRSEMSSREAAADKAKEELNSIKVNEAELEAKKKMALSNREDARNRLEAARKGESDEELSGRLALAQQKFDASVEAYNEVEGELKAADPDSLAVRLENARQAKRRAVNDLQSNRDRRNELRGSLELRGEMGLQGAYDEALSELESVKRGHEGAEARANAAKLLHDTFEKHQRKARQKYVKPFKERIEQFGRIVFGPTFKVEVDDKELRVVKRTLEGVPLGVDQLSTGAREQLGVLSRLACAAIVSPEDGGAPVMIDDALGWSDPQRLQSMGAAIASAGKQCQIVILTCYPGRYAHVGNAKVVRL